MWRNGYDGMGSKLLRMLLLCVCLSLTGATYTVLAAQEEEKPQETLYGIGSTSKVITAAAVLRLWQQGLIDLDTALVTYIPQFEMADERYLQITPRMLLDHSSGLPGSTLTNAMLFQDNDRDNHDHLLERLKGQRLKADPGAYAAYCNDGFTLAEILVEQVTGMSFTDYLEQNFWKPLSLTDMKTPQSPELEQSLAAIYDSQTGMELPPEFANVIGSGGIYATAQQLCMFAQVFMRDQGSAAGIISPQIASQMEVSTYDQMINPTGKDSNLSYGLGWDSVNAYPFNRYGVKALVKGGDTSYYHASLTVLPEENISCAVLTSGGNSTVCQLAVQEILLTYLEEIDRIERSEEREKSLRTETPSLAFPQDQKEYLGWYLGEEMLTLTEGQEGELLVTAEDGMGKKSQSYVYGEDGSFHSENGDYVGMDGRLKRGSNGTIGYSQLEWNDRKQGQTYLMAQTYETYPGLGTVASYLPLAQKILPVSVEADSVAAWQKRAQKDYYLVSETYSSVLYYTRFVVQPRVSEIPQGYLSFNQSRLPAAIITGADSAMFFKEIPGQAGRDLMDYQVELVGDQEYLIGGDLRYLSEDSMETLPSQDTVVTIEQEGVAQWYRLNPDQDYGFVTVTCPGQASFFVYDNSKKEPTCVASSYTTGQGQKFLLPAQGNMVFVAEKGKSFTLTFSR